VGFLDPKQRDDEDEALPGATGLHLDLDLRRCPSCRRELTPWQERCDDCGEVGVAASEVPAASFALDLSHLDADEDTEDTEGAADAEVARDAEVADDDRG
jgi:hypothetical protein